MGRPAETASSRARNSAPSSLRAASSVSQSSESGCSSGPGRRPRTAAEAPSTRPPCSLEREQRLLGDQRRRARAEVVGDVDGAVVEQRQAPRPVTGWPGTRAARRPGRAPPRSPPVRRRVEQDPVRADLASARRRRCPPSPSGISSSRYRFSVGRRDEAEAGVGEPRRQIGDGRAELEADRRRAAACRPRRARAAPAWPCRWRASAAS